MPSTSSTSPPSTPALKSRGALQKLNKPQIIDYAIGLGDKYENLCQRLFDPQTGVIVKLQSQLQVAGQVNAVLNDRLVRMERNINRNSQYSRKETLELHKFPKEVKDDDLETKVVEILNAIKEPEDDPITPADFHACHRLSQKDRGIVKMTHRKRMRAVIKSRTKLAKDEVQKRLKIGRIFIVESMAGPYKRLFYQCQKLKSAGHIQDCWFYNGTINVVLVANGDSEHIYHVEDILKLLHMSDDELAGIVGD